MPFARIYWSDTGGREVTSVTNGPVSILDITLTHSWGAQPSTATVVLSQEILAADGSIFSMEAIPISALVKIEIGDGTVAHTFWGRCDQDLGEDSGGGKTRTVVFKDLRDYLSWDAVYGAFNIPNDYVEVISGVVYRRRRWKHLLPANWATNNWTFSSAPMDATTILGYLIGASTVESAWVLQTIAVMADLPVYGLDWRTGVKLDAAITTICDRLGLVFTLYDAWTLRFRRKGELITSGSYTDANMPWNSSPFPLTGGGAYIFPPNSDQLRVGNATSGAPERVHIIGSPNRYQVLGLTLVADWASAWEQWWDEHLFTAWVYNNLEYSAGVGYSEIAGDTGNVIGWQAATAKALQLTVGNVADVLGGTYIDAAMFGNISRMDMPAILYIRTILFRAFRLPDTVLGRAAKTWEIIPRSIVRVGWNAAGEFSAPDEEALDGLEDAAAPGAGVVLVQGLGFSSEWAMQTLQPDRFDFDEWTDANAAWTPVGFTIQADRGDGSGFILLDRPAVDASGAYAAITSGSKTYAAADAAATIGPAEVRATLTLAGEIFGRYIGTGGTRDEIAVEPNLHHEFVYQADGTLIYEIPFADGTTPVDRANEIGASLLTREWYYKVGGFVRHLVANDGGVKINGMLDRVTLRVSDRGVSETVDFTTERTANAFIPERTWDRAVMDRELAPGQREIQHEAGVARALLASLQQKPEFARTLAEAFTRQLGINAHERIAVAGAATTLDVGTPLWSVEGGNHAVLPAASGTSHVVFQGVTVRHNEESNTLPLVQKTGRVIALVNANAGAVAVGDPLGRLDATGAFGKVASNAVATAREGVPSGQTRTVWVDLGSGSGGGTEGGVVADGVYFGGIFDMYLLEPTWPVIGQELISLGNFEARGSFDKAAGYTVYLQQNLNGYEYLSIAYPEEWGEPEGVAVQRILDLDGSVNSTNPSVTFLGRGSAAAIGFGHLQDSKGRWYINIGWGTRTWRVYMLNVTNGDFFTLYHHKFWIHGSAEAEPTMTPNGGALGSYPASITINCASGASITWKAFTTGAAVETPTPGSNGWSALASLTATGTVSAGQELRAQALTDDLTKAPSPIHSAAFT